MKVKLLFIVMLLSMIMPAAAMAENEVIYNGIITRRFINSTTSVYEKMDKESTVLKYLTPGTKIEIVAIYPGWVAVKQGSNNVGYIIRKRIDVTSAVDPVNTPPYPAVQHYFYAYIDRTVEVKSEKSADSETLSTLTDGAKVAIVGIEDGWAKLIFHQQYGYVDTRELSEILPVAGSEAVADAETPMAVFTSFFNDIEDRINNLAVACNFISKVMQPGESMNFNETVGPFSAENGYKLAPVLKDGETKWNYGGGSCQVSSTLWDTLLQLPGITTLYRRPHGDNGASYLPHGMDASSGTKDLNLIFRNDYDFPIRIEASIHDRAMFVAVYKEMP